MAGLALAGSAGGALCAGLLPAAVFRPLVLVGVVGVAVYVLRRPDLGDVTALRLAAAAAPGGGCRDRHRDRLLRRHLRPRAPARSSSSRWSASSGYAFLEASAQARIVNFATNLGALAGVRAPGRAAVGAGAAAWAPRRPPAGDVGARTAISRGSRFVRVVFLVVVGGLALRLGYDIVTGG